MISGSEIGKNRDEGRYLCAVCRKGVGNNSIYCKVCKLCVHKHCSGIKGRLKTDQEFKCNSCAQGECVTAEESVVVNCDGQCLDIVEKFCYLGDTIGARGSVEDSVTARIKSGWNKFRELLPLLASRGLPLVSKGKVFQACVRSVMLYGSETWPVKEEDIKRLEEMTLE